MKKAQNVHTNIFQTIPNESNSTIFLQATDTEEITNIIFSLNSNRACDPNKIPQRIPFLLKNETSNQLADFSSSPS